MTPPPKHIYLNTASCGLIAPENLAAGNKLYERFQHSASAASEEWRMNEQESIRQLIADFIGADAKNVAMVPNFTWAINAIVQSLKGTEKVLLYKGDYPSFLEPFRINNFDITWVDAPDGFNIDMDLVKDAITNNKVDIVAMSHAQWNTGYKTNIKETGDLCRLHGVTYIVDGTQSLGANIIDLSELNIDVFAASSYKWMNAGFGTGVLYATDDFLAKYPPVVGGHNSYKLVDGQFKYVPSINSYEPGSPDMFGLMVLASAIEQKNKIGIKAIEAHNLRLTAFLLDNLKETPVRLLGDHTMASRAPFIYLADENGLGDHIKQHGITVTQRNELLRVSMHFYNTEDDVLAFAACVKAFYKK